MIGATNLKYDKLLLTTKMDEVIKENGIIGKMAKGVINEGGTLSVRYPLIIISGAIAPYITK